MLYIITNYDTEETIGTLVATEKRTVNKWSKFSIEILSIVVEAIILLDFVTDLKVTSAFVNSDSIIWTTAMILTMLWPYCFAASSFLQFKIG